MSKRKADLGDGREILGKALRELADYALRGRDRKEAIRLAAAELPGDLLPTTVHEWFANGTPAKDFETLWALVRQLLKWADEARPGTPDEANGDRPNRWWDDRRNLWRTRWEAARASRPVTPGTRATPPRDRDAPEPGWWRSGSSYLYGMVRGLAPAELIGREDELALLHRFCVGDGRFMQWRGDLWSGKTALLATLVMHPPPGTEIVGFFVNSRMPGHHDIRAFSRWTLEQLWALLGRPGSPPVGEHADPLVLPRILSEANALVTGHGRRLVLVVDGLDEDLGPVVGWPRQRSIASLLTDLADEGTAVICAVRSTVELPPDIADRGHAFWRAGSTELQASPHVRDLQARAQAEIEQIVPIDEDAPEQIRRSREVLGYLTAAGGGLTTHDLEYLTGKANAVLRTALRGLAGRVLTSSDLDGRTTHFFRHELLRRSALTSFGLALGPYRDSIHTWASLLARSTPPWPEETPTYLRFGYSELLISDQDRDRLTRLAADPARQRLLLGTLGGDAASRAEVTAALEMHTSTCDPESAAEPDLAVLFRLAQRRDFLDGQTAELPLSLPAAWAALAERARGEALAASFEDGWRRAEAQRELEEGFRLPPPRLRTSQDPVRQAVVDSGLLPRRHPLPGGRSAALRITDPRRRLGALAALSLAAADQGRAAEALDLARSAEDLITWITRYELVDALVDVLDALAQAGERERAVALGRRWTARVTHAEDIDRFLPVLLRTEPAEEVLRRTHRAEDSAEDDGDARRYRRRALWGIVRWSLFTGQFAAAWDAASAIRYEFSTWRALDAVAHAVVRAGPTAGDIEHLVAGARSPDWERIAVSLLAAGRLGDAENTIRARLTWTETRARALTGLAVAVGATDPERGKDLLNEVHKLCRPGNPLADVTACRVRTLIAVGERHRAEAVAAGTVDPDQASLLLAEVAESWAETGNPEEAERIARTIGPLEVRARTFAAMAVRSPKHASRWHTAAFHTADELSTPPPFAVRAQLARAAIAARDFDAVAGMLRAVEKGDVSDFTTLLQLLAEPLAAAGAEHVLRPWFESEWLVLHGPVRCLAAAAKGAASRGDLAAAAAYVTRAADVWSEQLIADALVRAEFDPEDTFSSVLFDRDGDLCALAEALTAAGDLADAEELLDDRIDPIHAYAALTGLACAYLAADRTERAMAVVEKAHAPQRPAMLAALARRAAALDRIGLARRMVGRALLSGKAIVLLEEIARIAPDVARDLTDEL
ncbi:hypothetical protein ACFXDE_16315 [Kitasatospora sp. NPDC059408]|uniref:hypothetical protein n=1 Tax=Kitasatospora sp. NPDC059408 TaxID=3346823 RepID=UPI00368F51B6